MKTKSLLLILSLAAVLFGSIFFAGCGSKSLDGEMLSNVRPVVAWAYIPQDSLSHSSNPFLKWYGRDVDGQISALDYQYIVVLEEDADTYGGPEAMAALFPLADSLWTSLGNVTSAQIPLFASADTSVFVDQYVFLKCQDDYGDYSNIIYLYLSRNNHPPTCAVFVPEGPQWCLPDTSDFWHGINVSWEGKDSLDYTGIQPDFLWEVRWYGPFADSASADTFSSYYYLADGETGERKIPLESFTFTDLVTGWYLVYVRNFDDASVPSEPALGYLEVYEPNWVRHPGETKDVLILNRTAAGTYNFFGNPQSGWADSVSDFYANVLADAGIVEENWDWLETAATITDLYMYRLVIINDLDWNQDVSSSFQEPLVDYLNVGGRLWVQGRMSFYNTSSYAGRYDYGEDSSTEPLPYTYLGLNAAYFQEFDLALAELIGAEPVQGTNLLRLEADSIKIAGLRGYLNVPYEALPRIEFFMVRNSVASALYTFNSNTPNASIFHGFPVALRLENETFKTSYFSAPLFFMKYSQASQVTNEMLDWFLDR